MQCSLAYKMNGCDFTVFFPSYQEAIAYIPLILLVSGSLSSLISNRLCRKIGSKVWPLDESHNEHLFSIKGIV